MGCTVMQLLDRLVSWCKVTGSPGTGGSLAMGGRPTACLQLLCEHSSPAGGTTCGRGMLCTA